MRVISIVCALFCLNLAAVAQCDKNVTYNSGKADFIDSSGNSIRTKEGKIVVTLTKKDFILMHDDNEEDALRGNISNLTCEWKDAYKNGRTTFNSELIEKNGDKDDAAVSIEGKDGKLLILVRFVSKNMTLKVVPDGYDEVKE